MSNNQKPKVGRRPKKKPGREVAAAERDCLEGLRSMAREIVYQTPEVRSEKVARLKEAIEQGNYEIDSRKLAEILVEELLGRR